MTFSQQKEPPKELLKLYLEQIKEKERKRLEEKRAKIESEMRANQQDCQEAKEIKETEVLESATKRVSFIQGIEEMRAQN